MARIVPDARMLTIGDSGHYPWIERPEVLLPALDAFLSGRWPDGAVRV